MKKTAGLSLLLNYSHFMSHFSILVFPSVILLAGAEFALPEDEVIGLSFVMYLLFGLAAIPMGVGADRYGDKWFMLAFLGGVGGCMILSGLAPEPQYLVLTLSGIGLFSSIYHPVGLSMVSRYYKDRGKALGVNGVFGSLGIALAPLMTGFLGYVAGWRIAYILLGLPSVLLFFYFLIQPWQKPQEQEPKQINHSKNHLALFVILMLCVTLLGFCYRGTVVSLPLFFQDKLDLINTASTNSAELIPLANFKATLLVSSVYLFAAGAQWWSGRLADKYNLKRLYLIFHLSSLPFLLVLAFLAGLPLYLAAVGYVFFSLGMQPIENSFLAHLTPKRLRSTAYGLKFVLVLGVGATAVYLVKYLEGKGALQTLFLIESVLVALVILLILSMGFFSGRPKTAPTK